MDELISLNFYGDAKELLIASDKNDREKVAKLHAIQILHAKYVFVKLDDPRKALDLLDEIKSSPKLCVDLLPDFFNDEDGFADKGEFKTALNTMSDAHFKELK